MRQFGEVRRLDRLSLAGGEDRQRILKGPGLLLELEGILTTLRLDRRQRIARTGIDPLLALLEAQPVDGPGARLVHDPSQDGTVAGVVAPGPAPDVVEHIHGEL